MWNSSELPLLMIIMVTDTRNLKQLPFLASSLVLQWSLWNDPDLSLCPGFTIYLFHFSLFPHLKAGAKNSYFRWYGTWENSMKRVQLVIVTIKFHWVPIVCILGTYTWFLILSTPSSCEIGVVVTIRWVRKLRPSEVKQVVQCHTACKG
jgi:hypothetical protein